MNAKNRDIPRCYDKPQQQFQLLFEQPLDNFVENHEPIQENEMDGCRSNLLFVLLDFQESCCIVFVMLKLYHELISTEKENQIDKKQRMEERLGGSGQNTI